MHVHLKDPGASLDYSINWGGGYLQPGETVAASVWTIFPGDMTQVSASFTPATATVTVSGGALGRIYLLTNRITTSADRIDERSITIRVEQR